MNPQASSTEDNLLEYDGLDCLTTTVISLCAIEIAALEITPDICHGPSLESAFHFLTKCHADLNGEAFVDVATNIVVTIN